MEDIYVPMNQEEATSSDEDEVEEDYVQQDDDLVDEDPSDAEISHVVRLWFGWLSHSGFFRSLRANVLGRERVFLWNYNTRHRNFCWNPEMETVHVRFEGVFFFTIRKAI